MIWRWLERHFSTFIKLSLLLLLAASAFDASGLAIAQDGSTPATSEAPPDSTAAPDTPVPDPPGHLPFTAWDEAPDPIPFDSLPPAEQQGVMHQAELSETNAGFDVAQKWSGYSHEMAELAAAETARRLAGLTGTDDIGVSP